jgi:addiction module RelE/StbE family toxin
MNVRYSRQFTSSYRKISPADRMAVIHAVELFQENPFDPSLNNHALAGRMTGRRAISVGHDLRVVFTERGGHQDVTLLDVGTHASVYRR